MRWVIGGWENSLLRFVSIDVERITKDMMFKFQP